MSLRASDVIASVRATLDYPTFDKLKQQLVLLKLREKVDHYFNRLSLTDRNWFLGSEVITVSSGVDEYMVVSPEWGRPILCETQDLSDPQHIRASIPIIDLQDRELFYQGPVQEYVHPLTDKHSATSWTFYRKPTGEVYGKVTPQPSQQADYLFWFEPNRPTPANLASNLVFLDNFQNLLVADLSLTCLPYCGYEQDILAEITPYRRITKAQTIKEALERDFQLYLRTFEEYVQQDRQEKVERKLLWGDSFGRPDNEYDL